MPMAHRMAQKKGNRRKTLVVDKDLQKKIILSVSLFPTAALAVASVIAVARVHLAAQADAAIWRHGGRSVNHPM